MTPLETKREAANCSCKVCKTITENDFYINVPKPQSTQTGRETVARWGNRPCRKGCGVMIKPGEKVWWEPNWGISHIECPHGK